MTRSKRAPTMERRYPLIKVGLRVVKKLLQVPPIASTPRTVELLRGGHVNSNYLVCFDCGQRFVLRIYAASEWSCLKEIGLLRSLAHSVSVPRLHLFMLRPRLFEYPYAILEWIDGFPLNQILIEHPDAAAQIGEEIALALIAVGKHALSGYQSFPIAEHVRECLFDRGAVRYLGPELSDRLLSLVRARSAFLRELGPAESLVHGDFQGDNILLRKKQGRWRLAGILDWEFAHNGCYLEDVGSLLRYEGEAASAFQHGLEGGFAEGGAALPNEWRMAARIWDTVANCEKLTHPRHRGDVTLRSIKLIERCVREYGR
jgi:aminoglycoside phosphotransferase (APT) family kinase protein